MNDLKKIFCEYIATHLLLEPKDKILLAISGGPDSMVLLHLFTRLTKINFGIFHLNHQLREEAEEEGEFVTDLAENLNIPCHYYRYNVPRYLRKTGLSLETGARDIRYQLIDQCMAKHGYTKTAFGHHSDDQAETVLLNLLRGTGLRGLAGMQPRREHYIRPLLGITKAEILAYCNQFNLKYFDDLSNFSTEFRRNKVRLELIPLIEKEYNPQFSKHLTRLANIISADEHELSQQAEEIAKDLTDKLFGTLRLKRDLFYQLSIGFQRRVLQICIASITDSDEWVSFENIELLRQYILKKNQFNFRLCSLTISGDANNVLFGQPELPSWQPGKLQIPGRATVGNFCIETKLLSPRDADKTENGGEDFDLDKLKLPLTYRKRQAGDQMQVFGSSGKKKLKDILIDAKTPRYLRDEIPLICDAEEIILVSGIRRSEKGRISPGTRQILRITTRILSPM